MTAQESKGFEIALYEAKHLVSVRIWGHWDRKLTKTYRHALGEKLDDVCKNGEEWWVLVNVTAFHPRTENVERMLCEQIETVSRRGIKKIAYLGTGAAVQLQFNQLFQKVVVPQCAFFEAQECAMHWLLSE